MSQLPDAPRSGSATWLTGLGILQLIAGVLVLLSPLMAGALTATFLGIMLVLAGVVQFVAGLRSGSGATGALVTLVAGLVIWLWPGLGFAALALVVGGLLLLVGIFKVVAGLKRRPHAGWLWTVVAGALAIVLAVYILGQGAAAGAVLVGIVVGIHLFVSGLSMTLLGRALAART